jgi:biopolymer transport protein ExbB/TolQ
MNLWQMFQAGGITMYILLAGSTLSWTVILERLVYFNRKSKVKRERFMADIAHQLKKEDYKRVLELCRTADTPFAHVVAAGVNQTGKKIANSMDRQITIETNLLERFINIEANIGSTAVYIGLFGTVLGIMNAFHDISANASGEINVVIKGISEALICTAMGLFVSVPAVIAYNFFVQRIDKFVTEMELCRSEMLDLMSQSHE